MGSEGFVKELDLKYTARYNYLCGKSFVEGESKNKLATDDMLNRFIEIAKTSKAYSYYWKITESSQQFWNGCKDIKELFPSECLEDIFFTCKIGKHYEGVPSKLVYLLDKAKNNYKYPNLSVISIKASDLLEFCYEGSLLNCTIHDVLCNVWQSDIKLLSSYRKRALFGNAVEIYVSKTVGDKQINRIAALPQDIADSLSDKDISSIMFDDKKGLVLGDSVVRQMSGHVGITMNDFDLVGVI